MVPFQTGDDGQMIREPLDPPLRTERHPESFCTSAVNCCASSQSVSLSFLKVHLWIIMYRYFCAAKIYFTNSDDTVQKKGLIFV